MCSFVAFIGSRLLWSKLPCLDFRKINGQSSEDHPKFVPWTIINISCKLHSNTFIAFWLVLLPVKHRQTPAVTSPPPLAEAIIASPHWLLNCIIVQCHWNADQHFHLSADACWSSENCTFHWPHFNSTRRFSLWSIYTITLHAPTQTPVHSYPSNTLPNTGGVSLPGTINRLLIFQADCKRENSSFVIVGHRLFWL